MENIFYLILIDNGNVICAEKEGHAILPCIKCEETFKSSQDAKKYFCDKTKLDIKKNDFSVAQVFAVAKLCIFSVAVDVNYHDNFRN